MLSLHPKLGTVNVHVQKSTDGDETPMSGETWASLEPSCNDCDGECLAACFNDAIVHNDMHGYLVIEDNCAGCGACLSACNHGLISLEQGIAHIAEAALTT